MAGTVTQPLARQAYLNFIVTTWAWTGSGYPEKFQFSYVLEGTCGLNMDKDPLLHLQIEIPVPILSKDK